MSTCRKTIGSLYTIRKFPFIQNIIETKFCYLVAQQTTRGSMHLLSLSRPLLHHKPWSVGKKRVVPRRGGEIILSPGGRGVRPSLRTAEKRRRGRLLPHGSLLGCRGLDFSTPHPLPPPPLPRRRRRPSLRTIPQCRAPGRP